MKKFIKVIVTTLLLATLVTPTFASNYVNPPVNPTPVDTTGTTNTNPTSNVSGTTVLNLLSAQDSVTLFINNQARIDATILDSLKGTDKELTMVANGYSINILGSDITGAQTLNLGMTISTPSNNVLRIQPTQQGDFMTKLRVIVPQASLPTNLIPDLAHLFYIDDALVRTDMGPVQFLANGAVVVPMSHASYYEIANVGSVPTTPTTPENPNTGDNSALPLAVGLFVAAIALVSIFKNKKVEA